MLLSSLKPVAGARGAQANCAQPPAPPHLVAPVRVSRRITRSPRPTGSRVVAHHSVQSGGATAVLLEDELAESGACGSEGEAAAARSCACVWWGGCAAAAVRVRRQGGAPAFVRALAAASAHAHGGHACTHARTHVRTRKLAHTHADLHARMPHHPRRHRAHAGGARRRTQQRQALPHPHFWLPGARLLWPARMPAHVHVLAPATHLRK